jgi:chorismate-pyruvate lyase
MTPFIDDILNLLDPGRDGRLAREAAYGIEELEAAAMPEPYRSLLVHERDMTGTLGAFWKSRIELRPLLVARQEQILYRRVVLAAVELGIPVEAGAIRIFLKRFPSQSLQAIIQNQRPLGAILTDYQIDYRSSPQGYFRIRTNGFLREAFGDVDQSIHYGRHNRLLDPAGEMLAEVVEILPVVEAR